MGAEVRHRWGRGGGGGDWLRMRKNSFAHHCKGLSIFFIIITSVQNVSWGGGGSGEVQGRCKLFPKFKNDGYYFIILLLFYSHAFGGREGICKRSTFCTLVKMLKNLDDP